MPRRAGRLHVDPAAFTPLVSGLGTAAASEGVAINNEAGAFALMGMPWLPAASAGLAAIQVVRLAGQESPESMGFEGPACSAWLYDLGPQFESLSSSGVAEAVARRASRGRRAWQQSRPAPWPSA